MYDLLVRNARMVTHESILEADIAVKDGKFAAFFMPGSGAEAAEVIEASGLLVFPGFIDCHSHYEDPGYTRREDFATGTRAAAVGGLTTVMDMPLDNDPAPVDPAGLAAKRAAIAEKACIDYNLWGAVVDYNNSALPVLAADGLGAFKGFALPRGVMKDGPFTGASLGDIRDALTVLKGTGAVCGFHCESFELISCEEGKLRTGGPGTAAEFLQAHDVLTEYITVQNVIAVAEATGGRVHICHVSHPQVAQLVKDARARGVDVSAETCAHYLGFDDSVFEEKGVLAKGTPPIRDAAAKEGLWAYVLDGTLSCIGSDHSPAEPEEKDPEKGFWRAWGGMNSTQVFVSRMFDLVVHRKKLCPTLLTRTMCWAPAKRFGLWGKKGAFRLGFDADLVFIDPEKEWTVRKEDLLTKHPVSVYEGVSGVGCPVRTVVRGRTVALEGRSLDCHGYGREVKSEF